MRGVELAEMVGVEDIGILHPRFLRDEDRPMQRPDLQTVTLREVLQIPNSSSYEDYRGVASITP